MLYHFHLIGPLGDRRDVKSIRLGDMQGVWKEVGRIADHRHADGRQIRVLNDQGGIIIQIGVQTAREMCDSRNEEESVAC